VVINAFTELGLDTVVGDRRAWVNVSRDFLVRSMAFALPRDRVVLELLEDQAVDADLIAALDLLRADGYRIALDDFSWSEEREPLLPHVDIVKVELLNRDPAEVAADVEKLRPYGATLLAEKVETREDYDRCVALGFEYFQGYFFCKPETMSARGVAPNRLAMLQLVAALQDPNIEFGQLETLISRDVALSYRLLRYINSAFFGLRREVDSIGRALALLGLENVKRWSTLTIFAGIDEKPREVIVTGLARARFCELAGPRFYGEAQPDRLFTLGLFSVIDALMDSPMADVLSTIPFPKDMTDALVERKGPKGELLEAALACERGEFPNSHLAQLHYESLGWASEAAEQLFEGTPAAAAA
jgi:c-di-GMP phosphodiesterase